MMRRTSAAIVARTALLAATAAAAAQAHDGPPFPIVSKRIVGPYEISVWADPDATDDGSAGGQFWVVLEAADRSSSIPPATRADVTIQPRGHAQPPRSARAEPVGASVSPQFAALVLDHEGKYTVRVSIDGPLGAAGVEADVEVTYHLRPAPVMLVVYAMPFVLVGALWIKLLLRRRSRTG
jgi:hypothetical protein